MTRRMDGLPLKLAGVLNQQLIEKFVVPFMSSGR